MNLAPDLNLTAAGTEVELTARSRAVEVAPPYFLVGNSYGSLVAREFLDLHTATDGVVVGMFLPEAATELLFEVSPTLEDADYNAVTAGVDFIELTPLLEESRLSDEEWEAGMSGIARTELGSTPENQRGGSRPSAAKKQFQNQALGK